MCSYTKAEMTSALQSVASFIGRCEKMQDKYEAGSSHHTLLRNRLHALYTAKSLIEAQLMDGGKDDAWQAYPKEALCRALPPVLSIISKSEKARSKYAEGSAQFRRFDSIIGPMRLSKALMMRALQAKEDIQ